MAFLRATITSPSVNTSGFVSLAEQTTTAGRTGLAAAVTVGNTTNVVDHEVMVSVVVGAITPSSSTVVNVFVYGSVNGTTWPGSATNEPVTGAEKQFTQATTGNNMIFLGSIPCTTASVTHTSKPLSVAAAFGGSMPAQYQIAIQNVTGGGVALAASGHSIAIQEIYYS